jgi:DNA-directed RNA polymerase specialized sigma24 family protein
MRRLMPIAELAAHAVMRIPLAEPLPNAAESRKRRTARLHGQLTPDVEAVIRQSLAEGLSGRKTARRLGVPCSTAASWIRRLQRQSA